MSDRSSNHTPTETQGVSTHQPPALDYIRPSTFHRDIQSNERGWQLAVDTNADENALPNGLATIEREARQDPTPGESQFLAEDIARDEAEITRQEEIIYNSENAIVEHEEAVVELKDERTQKAGHLKKESIIPVVFGAKVVALVIAGLFVFMFYNSAAYISLLSNPLAEIVQTGAANVSNITQSIFRGDAFQRAWEMGWAALLLMLSFPAIIIGLGILLPFAKKDDPFLRRPSTLTGLALLFDVTLAIGIERNIWILNEHTGTPQNVFFIITTGLSVVLFGFVSYAVFGFLFEHVVDAWKSRNPVYEIDERIAIQEAAIPPLQARIREAREAIASHRAHKRYLERILDGGFKDWTFTQAKIAEFVNGWCRYIEATRTNVEQRISRARAIQAAFLQSIKDEYGVPSYSS